MVSICAEVKITFIHSLTLTLGVTSLYAMEASPGGPPVSEDIIEGNGGEAGIWQGGMSAAVDGNRLFITTGYVTIIL